MNGFSLEAECLLLPGSRQVPGETGWGQVAYLEFLFFEHLVNTSLSRVLKTCPHSLSLGVGDGWTAGRGQISEHQ